MKEICGIAFFANILTMLTFCAICNNNPLFNSHAQQWTDCNGLLLTEFDVNVLHTLSKH